MARLAARWSIDHIGLCERGGRTGEVIMNGPISPEAERVEREIREKIDAIFEQENTDYTFIREASGEVKASSPNSDAGELLAELKSFYDLLAEERSTLKALLHLLPQPGDLQEGNPEEIRRKIMELIADIRRIGRNVGPTLDRLLRLTERILQTSVQD